MNHIVTKENGYLPINTKITSNWDCTWLYANNKPLDLSIIKRYHEIDHKFFEEILGLKKNE